ncbi:MAG: DUF4340 domain-containing protein [Gammaproteobacteria bacterium]
MSARIWLNLLMLAAVLVLAAVTVYKPGIEPDTELPPLTTLAPDAVQRIEIQRGDSTLALERRSGGWWIAGEPAVPADPLQVDMLLRLPGESPQRSYAAADLDLAQLKLVPGLSRVRFDDREFVFGDTDPLQGLRYVQVGDRVHLINDRYQGVLQGGHTQLASRRLLPDGAEITALELPGLSARKQDDGGWTVAPAPERLSADAAPRLAQAWNRASALWVRSYQPAEGGEPITLTLADGSQIHLELRRAPGETVFARPDLGLQYQFPEASARPLLTLEMPAEAESEGE